MPLPAISFNTHVLPFIKYLGTTIAPVFLGSFVLAGALAKYSNHDALNKTIIETAYKPSKEKFRECNRVHNRLFLAEQELAGTYDAVGEELQFLEKNGNQALPQEYQYVIPGLLKQTQSLNEEIPKLRKDSLGCYEVLHSQLADLGLLLGSANEVQNKLVARATSFNMLEQRRTKAAADAIAGIDPRVMQDAMRKGFERVYADNPGYFVNGYRQLANQARALSAVDKQLFDMERKTYGEINTLATAKIEARLSKGIWAFLFG